MSGPRRVLGFLLGAALLAVPAHADSIDDSLFAPEEKCGYCHGIDGNSATGRFPRLGGQRFEYLLKQLGDFRAGRRRNDDGVMATNAEPLQEPDVARIARYFSEQKQILGQPQRDGSTAAMLYWQGKGATPACVTCHGDETQAPRLAGQHAAYLEKQLREWRTTARANDRLGEMRAVSLTLSEEDVVALAAYLATHPPAPNAQP